jgi:hypothetical protein
MVTSLKMLRIAAVLQQFDRTGCNSSHRPRHTVQAARRRFLTADTRVQYRMPLSGTRGEQSGSGLSFSLRLLIRA